MGRILIAAFAMAAALASLPSHAADVPRPPPVAVTVVKPVAAPNWSGHYVGVTGGWTWLASHIFSDSGNYTGNGGILGATVGANWQAPGSPWVWGLEGDWSWSNAKATKGVPNCGPDCVTRLHWLATVRGRFGYAGNRILLYVTGGVAFDQVAWGQPGLYFPTIKQAGWTAGGGVEGMLAGRWSWKAEVLYAAFEKDVGLSATGCPSPPNFACGDYNRFTIARVGLNYKF